MHIDREFLVTAYMVLLIAPILIFGIWLRLKLWQSDEGKKFLVDRDILRVNGAATGQRALEIIGKMHRFLTDCSAISGEYGEHVSRLVSAGVSFSRAYFVYATIVIALMVWSLS